MMTMHSLTISCDASPLLEVLRKASLSQNVAEPAKLQTLIEQANQSGYIDIETVCGEGGGIIAVIKPSSALKQLVDALCSPPRTVSVSSTIAKDRLFASLSKSSAIPPQSDPPCAEDWKQVAERLELQLADMASQVANLQLALSTISGGGTLHRKRSLV